MSRLRVVLDTNVLVSGVAYPLSVPAKILLAWRQGAISVTLSHYILNEVVRVLPRFSTLKLSDVEMIDLVDSLTLISEIVTPIDCRDEDLRDPADQQILGTLLASQSDYLISGDKDLLALREKYPIITPAQFWAKHG